MRIFVLALAAVAALAAPVFAGAFTGYRGTGEIYLGGGRNYGDDSDVDEQSPFIYGARAGVFMQLGESLTGHLDLFFENGLEAVDDGETDYVSGGGVLHINYTKAQRFALGMAAGLFGGTILTEEDQTYWMLAAEGRFPLERASLWFQAGYFDALQECHMCYQEFWHEVSFVRAGVAYFIEDDLRLGAEIASYAGYVEGQDQAPLRHLSLELEQQFGDQMSGFVRYRNTYFANEDEDDPLTQHAVFIGVRLQWGEGSAGTLRANEQYRSLGAPDVAYSIAVSDEFD